MEELYTTVEGVVGGGAKPEPDSGREQNGNKDMDRMEELEREVETLKTICGDLIRVTRQVEQTKERKPLLKPRDIPILELSQLKGVEGEGKLGIFLSQVENCSLDSEERKRIVTARVDAHIAMYVQAMLKDKEDMSWIEFRKNLTVELTDQNPNNLYDELGGLKYDIEEDPMEFVAKLRCKFAILRMKGGGDAEVNIERILKKKMVQGLPRQSRERLELFKEDKVTLKRFLERFSQERTVALAQEGAGVRQIKEEGEEPEKVKVDEKLAELERKLEQLKTDRSVRRKPFYSKYCPYCRSASHNVRDCNKRPQPGSCFDCLRMNCRRGQTGCPGRVNNTR